MTRHLTPQRPPQNPIFVRRLSSQNLSQFFCVNISEIVSMNTRVTAARVTAIVASDSRYNLENSSGTIMRNWNFTPQKSKECDPKQAPKPPYCDAGFC